MTFADLSCTTMLVASVWAALMSGEYEISLTTGLVPPHDLVRSVLNSAASWLTSWRFGWTSPNTRFWSCTVLFGEREAFWPFSFVHT